MIHCPKCGADNHIGVIFCRSCGDRMNLDEIRPQAGRGLRHSPAVRGLVIAYRVLLLLCVAVLVAVLVGFFLPPAGRRIPVPDEKSMAETRQLYESMFRPQPKQQTFAFSSAQVTALANERLGLKRGSAGDAGLALVPERLEIDCLASGYLRIVLQSRLKGRLAVYSTLVLHLDKTDNGVKYQVVAARAGRISMPVAGWSFVTQRVLPLFQGDTDLPLLAQLLTNIDVTDDSLGISIKATAKDKEARNLLLQRR